MHTFLRTVASYLVNGVEVYLTSSGLSYDSSGIFRGILQTNFDIEVVGSKLCEDYHRPELEFTKYEHFLYKLDFKFKTKSSK
ncbi:MAG: hypothetical protein NC918_03925 [Candidatus Omnitrophica bacterium]|nr:hypothetical protein [Candidatus Omnitrophota bacterium]